MKGLLKLHRHMLASATHPLSTLARSSSTTQKLEASLSSSSWPKGIQVRSVFANRRLCPSTLFTEAGFAHTLRIRVLGAARPKEVNKQMHSAHAGAQLFFSLRKLMMMNRGPRSIWA